MKPLKKTKEMRRWDKVLKELAEGLEAQKCTSCGAYPGQTHTNDCSVWDKVQRLTNQPAPEVIKKAGRKAKLLQDVQSAMWDAVIKRDHGVMVNFISVAKEIISMVERSKR